ncbi:MAG: barA 2 [Daejeonella sp.]|nr:barA 2 [Daejeonella sp.]
MTYGKFENKIYTALKVFILVVCSVPTLLLAQQPNVKFTHLTNLDGLSQSSVEAFLKDKQGYMWFGTQDGLNKYDGYKFTVYRYKLNDPKSLRKSYIYSLYEDHAGNLWVGTNNGGLSLYNRKDDSFINYAAEPDNPHKLSSNSITSIYEDKRNNLWVGTYRNLNLFNRKTGEVTRFISDSANNASLSHQGITCMLEDKKHNLWVGTQKGLNIFDRKTKRFQRFFNRAGDSSSISNNYILNITEDVNGNLWIGTENGLNLFDHKKRTFTRFTQNPHNPNSLANNKITGIEDAGKGKLWIGTANGLDLFNTHKNTFTHFKSDNTDERSLARTSSVNSLFYDKSGILWVCTSEGGINIYNKNLSYLDLYRNNPNDFSTLSFNNVTGFAENKDGDIWITTGGGGLNLWNRQTNFFKHFNPDPANSKSLAIWGLISIIQGKTNDYVWIGTYGKGLERYDPKTNTFKHYPFGKAENQVNNDAIYSLFEDSRGNIWMGTNGGGVNVLNPKTDQIKKYLSDYNKKNTIASNYVRAFCEDKKGNIWIGTTNGLAKFNVKTEKITRFDPDFTRLSSNLISSLYADNMHNKIWIGTRGGGISELDLKTYNVISYSESSGLPNNTINAIVPDAMNNLWLSTNNGISKFNLKTKVFKNYNLSNGLQSFAFSGGAGLRAKNGDIFFGGENGFNALNPATLPENKVIPAVVISDFQLFNKQIVVGAKDSPLKEQISVTKEITLTYDQSVITFEYTSLSFTASSQNQYAYTLVGFDRGWNYVGTARKATYTNLDPGEYTFKVKAANNDGLWNNEGTSLKLIILPPIWMTWWFRVVLSFFIGAIIYAAYYFRIQSIEAQKLLLEQQVQARTKEVLLQAQNLKKVNNELLKTNADLDSFVYSASHDLRAPLTSILGLVNLIKIKVQQPEILDLLNLMVVCVHSLDTFIKDIIDFSRNSRTEVEYGIIDFDEVISHSIDQLRFMEEAEKIKITYTVQGDDQFISDKKRIAVIINNLLSNAIKYSDPEKSNSQIDIEVIKHEGFAQLQIKDNGLGISPENSIKIFDMFYRASSQKTGAGLGLYIVKEILTKLGGAIKVHSIQGQETVFVVDIPQYEEVAAIVEDTPA